METKTDTDYADDVALLTESQLHNPEQGTKSIDFNADANKTVLMSFKSRKSHLYVKRQALAAISHLLKAMSTYA